ncbi:MAG: YfaP family protein, partial [Allomuricauda sp.]
VFDIDGLVVQDAPIWINIDNIRRVAVFSGLQTTGLYGGLGAGGVVVINTKTGTTDTMFKSEESQKKVFNPNFFDGNALSYKEVLLNNAPQYLKKLHSCQTFGEAKSVYRALSKQYHGHPYFFLDAFSYFTEKWGNKNFAEQIIEKHYTLFDNNPVLLKALAYQFEEKGFHKKANTTYTDVAKLRTNYIQSYLDLASNSINLRNSNRALDLYLRIDDLIKKDFFKVDSSSSFQKFYAQEVKSAFPLKPNYYAALAHEDLESATLDGNTRIVFEWNDGDAEFELQFVAPSGQFTTWKHTNSANAELMLNEKRLGLNSKDFFIDDFQEGIWKINLAYLGNKSLTPTYLKVRIYENYGTDQQSKKQKVFKLAVKETNQELFTLAKVKSNPVGAN